MALQNLRSNTANKRPTASGMVDGQVAINTNATNPGLFFKDAGDGIRKVGPVFIGSSAPNSSPATGGSSGHSIGEQWLDTSNSRYIVKTWDGTAWRDDDSNYLQLTGGALSGGLTVTGDVQARRSRSNTAGNVALSVQPSDSTIHYGFRIDQANNNFNLDRADNNSTLLTVTGTGAVGIGNTAPSAKLQIEGTSDQLKLTYPSIASYIHEVHSNGDYSVSKDSNERLRIDSSGNLGIATTSPENYGSGYVTVEARGASGDAGGIFQTRTYDASVKSYYYCDSSTDTARIGTVTSHPFLFVTGTTERMRIASDGRATFSYDVRMDGGTTSVPALLLTANNNAGKGLEIRNAGNSLNVDIGVDGDAYFAGNFGVGTSTPSMKVNISHADQDGLRFNSVANGETFIDFADPDDNDIGRISYDHSDNHMAFRTNNGERMRITNDGKIGMGVSSPRGNLHLHSSSATRFDLTNTATGTTSGDGSTISIDGSTGALNIIQREAQPINFSTSNTQRAIIDSSGRLLVGSTSAPAGTDAQYTKFAIRGNTLNNNACYLSLGNNKSTADTTSNDNLGIITFNDNDSDAGEYARITGASDGNNATNDYPGKLIFATTADGASSPTERLRIDSAGNVGVGVSNPSTKLQLPNQSTIRFGDSAAAPKADISYSSTGFEFLDIKCQGTTTGYGNIRFYTGATPTERMLIDDSGLVGINETNPAGSLHINAASGVDGPVFDSGGAGNNSHALLVRDSADSQLLRVNNNGKVGISTSTMDGQLEVRSNQALGIISRSINTQSTDSNKAYRARNNSGTDTFNVSYRGAGYFADNVLFGRTSDSSTSPGHTLNGDGFARHVRNGNIVMAISRGTDDGTLVIFQRAGVEKGTISVSGNTVTYGAFCGTHWGRLEDNSKPEILPGTILETINKAVEWKVVEFTVDGEQKRQAYNGSEENGASVTVEYEGVSYTGTVADEEPNSEDLNKHVCVKVNDTAASKAVFGVFLGWDADPNEENGVLGAWNDMNIAALGNYFIRIKSGQSLEIGDLIEPDGTGCGVVQSDDIIRSKTVGKVTSTTPQQVYPDGSFLVTCVLYSG